MLKSTLVQKPEKLTLEPDSEPNDKFQMLRSKYKEFWGSVRKKAALNDIGPVKAIVE